MVRFILLKVVEVTGDAQGTSSSMRRQEGLNDKRLWPARYFKSALYPELAIKNRIIRLGRMNAYMLGSRRTLPAEPQESAKTLE